MPSWIYFLHAPRENFAADRAAAEAIMAADPAIAGGIVTGELREMRVSLLRGRD
jgi:hypothetical protein